MLGRGQATPPNSASAAVSALPPMPPSCLLNPLATTPASWRTLSTVSSATRSTGASYWSPLHSSPHPNLMGPRVDSGLLSQSWVFHARAMCCIDIRALTALVCAVTIAINLLLWRMQARKDLHAQQQLDSSIAVAGIAEHTAAAGLVLSANTASNCFSVFAYSVGLLAVCAQSGGLSSAFFHYALADTLFAVVPKAAEAVALALHPGTLMDSGTAGAGSRRLMGCLFTLVVNLLYNLPCLAVAVAFKDCFELRLSATTVRDGALDGAHEDNTAPAALVAYRQ